jgi:hypothetical protein
MPTLAVGTEALIASALVKTFIVLASSRHLSSWPRQDIYRLGLVKTFIVLASSSIFNDKIRNSFVVEFFEFFFEYNCL